MIRAVLYDLDGTLVDSGSLIMQTIARTMASLSGAAEEPIAYRRFVGPPLHQSFAQLGVAPDQIERYVLEYRRIYAEVSDSTEVFPGITEHLGQVRELGLATAIATSKLETVAVDICDKIGLSPYFDKICGAQPETVHLGKEPVVGAALGELGAQLDPSEVVMVGDRIFDIEGAMAHGLKTIMVTWGDSWPEEYENAWRVVASVAELTTLLGELRSGELRLV